MSARRNALESPVYQTAMLVLCLFALGSLAAEVALTPDPEIATLLEYADYALCVVFLLDFAISFWRAPNRWKYFFRWGWLDLVSSIPTLDAARWGRAARVVRVFRVLRGLRAAKLVATVVLRNRAQNTFLAATLLALLLIVSCSVAILHFERGPEGNIKTAEDAIWWAFTTITTVGYGDRYPVTAEGRFVAAILMCAGVGLFGTLSAFLAAWLLSPEEAAAGSDAAELRGEIRALREELAALKSRSMAETASGKGMAIGSE